MDQTIIGPPWILFQKTWSILPKVGQAKIWVLWINNFMGAFPSLSIFLLLRYNYSWGGHIVDASKKPVLTRTTS